MEKMLVVVFDNEKKAYEGLRALGELDTEGSIAVYAESVIEKNKEGVVSLKQAEDTVPLRTVRGTAIGSLIGLLAGPPGVMAGAAVGGTAGMIGDLYVAGVDEDFLDDVSAILKPGKFAVVADVSEEWVTPVDTKMEAIGGHVFRKTRQHFEEERRARDIAALKADIEHLKMEEAHARAERKAKIQAEVDELSRKLQKKLDEAKKRSEQLKSEADAKVHALQQKAKTAQHETKTVIHNRITEIRQDYEHAEETLRHATAKQLKKAAAKLEKAG